MAAVTNILSRDENNIPTHFKLMRALHVKLIKLTATELYN